MKAVILCGGMGLRLGKQLQPKPLVMVGHRPIVWHIMKIYAHYGFDEFVLCLGYNGHLIKDYFRHYALHQSDCEINTATGELSFLETREPEFRIICADTGISCLTAGRLKKIEKYIDTEDFFVTYGDGLADIDVEELYRFHKQTGKIATVTGVYTKSQFGVMTTEGDMVTGFQEKQATTHRINGGFFVFNRRIFDYLAHDEMLEDRPMKHLVLDRQLAVYQHNSYWSCMDTYKDMEVLNQLWESGIAPWNLWDKWGQPAGAV